MRYKSTSNKTSDYCVFALCFSKGLHSAYWSLTISAIWRNETCKEHSGYRSTASIYNNIRDGLWTKAVPIGLRIVGWQSDEVEAINNYRIAGASDDQIRELVKRLHAERSELLMVTA